MIYQEASFTGVIRIIFYFFLISFIIRLVAKLALPYVIKKGEEAMRERAGQFHQPQSNRKEGEVTIETKGRKSSKKDDDDEYVDYVEIRN